MRSMIEKYLHTLREGEGGGSGGSGAAAAGGEGAAAGASAAGAAAGGASSEAGANGEGGSGAAAGGAAAAAAGQPYRPEGLPETMFGKDDRETMDKMANALKGYRQNDATVGKDADAYKAFDFDKLQVPAELKPHMEGLAKDPIMDAVAKYAFEQKLPVDKAQGLIMTAYAEAMKAGAFESFVDPAKERAALVPDSAKSLPQAQQDAAIDARLKANEDWVKLNTQSEQNPNGMPKDVAEHMLLMLMDTAKGNQAIEWMKGRITGAGTAQPMAGNGGQAAGALTAESLRARQALPENTVGNPKFSQASYDALMADYRKLHGTE